MQDLYVRGGIGVLPHLQAPNVSAGVRDTDRNSIDCEASVKPIKRILQTNWAERHYRYR